MDPNPNPNEIVYYQLFNLFSIHEKVNAVTDEIRDGCTKRRLYILAYFLLSLTLNEVPYFSAQSANPTSPEDFNIVSLGYLSLLFYDLSTNLDQLILRFLIKVKFLGNLVNEYGFNNILSYNWFYRLKVPFMLRTHLLAKAIIFTVNFCLFYSHYSDLNKRIEESNKLRVQDSLVAKIQSLFRDSNGTGSDLPSITEDLAETGNCY